MSRHQHTPDGVRDIYNTECAAKLATEEKLLGAMRLYGYRDIQTPSLEYFDVFGKDKGSTPSKDLYKLFDKEGNTLVLRPDITPSVARAAATVFDESDMPLRLCYRGNAFTNPSGYQGKLHETTHIGAELIGEGSAEADAEMIAMAADALRGAGLDDFQIYVGDVDFFEGLISGIGLDDEHEEYLRRLIKNRNSFGVEELLDECGVKVTAKTAFQILPELTGGVEVLKEAKKIALSPRCLKAVSRLEEMYEALRGYGVGRYVTFDLGISGDYGYYTGVIFHGYTYGIGDAVVKGGRYDSLIAKFGRDLPAVGFVIVADELMKAISRQKINVPLGLRGTYVLYDGERHEEAALVARDFRKNRKPTLLMKKNPASELDFYIAHAKKNQCASMMYLKAGSEIEMVNLLTGITRTMKKRIMPDAQAVDEKKEKKDN